MYKDDIKLIDIAKENNLSEAAINNILNRNNMEKRQNNNLLNKRPPATQEEKDRVILDYKNGKSISQISRETGIQRRSIYTIIEKDSVLI